jgi:membrane protein DedA with SNARE-associated domain
MLADLVETLTQALEGLVDVLGAPGVVLIAFAENMFPPTPSEFLYPLAGKLAADGKLTPIVVVIAGVTGSLMGALLYYTLGYKLGEERIRDAIDRYGALRVFGYTFAFVTVDDYDRSISLFRRYGGAIVCIARVMPLVHGVVSIPAGVVRMPLLPFIGYTILGAALWIAPLTAFGYWLGSNWERVLEWLDVYETLWYGIMAALLVAYIVYRVRRHRRNAHQDAADTAK